MRTFTRRLTAALPVRGWILLVALWAIAVAAAFATQVNWGLDSRLYLAWTYWYLGHSQVDSAHMAYDFLEARHALPSCRVTCWPAGYERDFFTGPYAAVVGPRVLLPLLSAPLVALFGPDGMMLIPTLSYLGGVVCIVLLASRLWGQRYALLAGALMLLPAYISRFAAVAHTEGTAVLLTIWPVLFLPLMRKTSRKDVVWFSVLIGISMANRQFAIALPFGVVFTWFFVVLRDRQWRHGRWRNEWWPFAVWGSVVGGAALAVQMLVTPMIFGGAGLSLTALFNSYSEKFFHTSGLPAVPRVFGHILAIDWDGVRHDILLVALLGASVVAVGWRFRSELSALTLGCFAAIGAINVLEFFPTLFRYHVPIVPLLVLAVVALLADLCGPARRRPSRSTETLPPEPATVAGATPSNAAPAKEAQAEPETPQKVPAMARTGADGTTGPAPPAKVRRRDEPRYPTLMLTPRLRGLRWLNALPVGGWVALIGIGTLIMIAVYDRGAYYGPDSRYHLAWAARFLGQTNMEATSFVWRELSGEGFFEAGACEGGCWQAGTGWLFAHAASVDPNLFYPLLMAPFVYLFHDDGMATVPFFSFVLAALTFTVFAARRLGMGAGLTVGLTFLVSDRVMAFGVTGMPDMIGIALCVLILLTLPLDGPRSRRALATFGLLVLLALMTRSTALAFVGAVGVPWLIEVRRGRGVTNRWAPFLVVSTVAAAVVVAAGQVYAAADARYLGRAGSLFADGLGGVLPDLVERTVELTRIDVKFLAADLIVCCVLLGAIAAMVTRLGKDPFAALALGGSTVCVLLQVLGGIPNGPRGFDVIYPILLLAAAGWLRAQIAGFGAGPAVAERPAEVVPVPEAEDKPPVEVDSPIDEDLDEDRDKDLASVVRAKASATNGAGGAPPALVGDGSDRAVARDSP